MSDPHLYLHHHPQQELLADKLISQLKEEKSTSHSLFESSCVIVQNRGMATWLRQRMVEKEHVCMQVDFPLPEAFLRSTIPQFIDHFDSQRLITKDKLLWMIFETLPKIISQPQYGDIFNTLNHYLNSNKRQSELKLYQLSEKIASVYDSYLIYRSDWIKAWEQGKKITKNQGIDKPTKENDTENWQVALWLSLREHYPDLNYVAEITQSISPSQEPIGKLPSAVHLFGFSNIPPVYSDYLHLISHHTPVHTYWMNPVFSNQGYWEDSPNKNQWLIDTESSNNDESSNQLLAQFGKMGREFVHSLHTGTESNYPWVEHQIPTHPHLNKNALGLVQAHIYSNKSKNIDLTDDPSIEIHSCHTPLREVQVLKDYIYKQLDEQGDLDLSDILVMCPDINKYHSAIDSVFGSVIDSTATSHSGDISKHTTKYAAKNIPYRISDRTALDAEPYIQAFIKLHQLHHSRFEQSEILSILSIPEIHTAFQLSEKDITQIEAWVKDTGIRWGLNKEHREQILQQDDVPIFCSWKEGIERLHLGFILHPNDPASLPLTHNGIYSDSSIQGGDIELIEKLATFIAWLETLHHALSKKRSIEDWIKLSQQWATEGIADKTRQQASFQSLTDTFKHILETQELLSQESEITADIYVTYIESIISKGRPIGGFLTGNLTFCEMRPMRSIPAKVICLIGMSHGSFPRKQNQTPFDLKLNKPRMGDRSVRDDDNYLLLESVLSARSSLYISYIGTSIRDRSSIPPSLSIQSIIDAYPTLNDLVLKEKLHAFDASYFSQHAPSSYDQQMLRSAQAYLKNTGKEDTPTLCAAPISEITDNIKLDLFTNSFTNSSKHFLKSVLKANTPWTDMPTRDQELLNASGLDNYRLNAKLNNINLENTTPLDFLQQFDVAPAGIIGKTELELQISVMKEIASIETHTITFSCEHENMTLEGVIALKPDDESLIFRETRKIDPKVRLIAHITALCYAVSINNSVTYHIMPNQGKQKSYEQSPDTERLSTLIEYYKSSYSKPLKFFLGSSEAYARTFLDKKLSGAAENVKKKLARDAALDAWNVSNYNNVKRGDALRIENTIIHGRTLTIDDIFHNTAIDIWGGVPV